MLCALGKTKDRECGVYLGYRLENSILVVSMGGLGHISLMSS